MIEEILSEEMPFIGLNQSNVDFDREERQFGKSKYIIGSIKGAIIGLLNLVICFY